jgi:hypothetical protein
MIPYLFSAIALFPLSFILYSLSERMIARHESRVGKQITFAGFLRQTWVDERVRLIALRPVDWLVILFQLSIVFLYEIPFEYLIFPYIAINGFLLIVRNGRRGDALGRIASDREQVSHAIASLVAGLCLLGAFTLSKTTNLATLESGLGHVLFVVPFQLAGMILFGEAPFRAYREGTSWLGSARFYAWSMVTVKVFLGGGGYFVDFQLKAASIYLFSRIVAVYVPSFRQQDLLRVAILYLFPLTGMVWLAVVLARGLLAGGVGV